MYLSVVLSIVVIGIIIGFIIGGVLVRVDWRWIFWFNLFVFVVGFVVVLLFFWVRY